jgi:hypothetical protein
MSANRQTKIIIYPTIPTEGFTKKTIIAHVNYQVSDIETFKKTLAITMRLSKEDPFYIINSIKIKFPQGTAIKNNYKSNLM